MIASSATPTSAKTASHMVAMLRFVLAAFLTLSTRITYGQVNIFISETGLVGGVLVADPEQHIVTRYGKDSSDQGK